MSQHKPELQAQFNLLLHSYGFHGDPCDSVPCPISGKELDLSMLGEVAQGPQFILALNAYHAANGMLDIQGGKCHMHWT